MQDDMPRASKRLHSFIGVRLIAALAVIAMVGLGTAGLSVYVFSSYGETVSDLVAIETGRQADISRFTEVATGIRADMPRLVFARSNEARQASRERLEGAVASLAGLLERIGRTLRDDLPESFGDSADLPQALAADIARIDGNVARHLAIRQQVDALVVRLNRLHDEALREIEPLIVDTDFNIRVALEALEAAGPAMAGAAPQTGLLQRELRFAETLWSANAHVNLLIGKLLRVAQAQDRDVIELLRQDVGEAVAGTGDMVSLLAQAASTVTLRQALSDIARLGAPRGALFELKFSETALAGESAVIVEEAGDKLDRLSRLVSGAVASAGRRSVEVAAAAREALGRGTVLLLALGGLLAVVALVVGWLTVGRQFIPRLSALLKSMRAIADGELDAPVNVTGQDEMGQLADALRTLQGRSQLARRRRLELGEINERLTREIDERRQVEGKLLQTQEELVQAGKMAALGQLSAGIAHEFNQPLAAMRSYLHNARRYLDQSNTGKVREKLEQVSGLVLRLADTSNHLKTLARRHTREAASCDPVPIVLRAAELFRVQPQAARIAFDLPREGDGAPVRADANRLEQVLINLIGNAVDAVEERKAPRVAVSVRAAGERVVIEVADNGCGIPDDVLGKVFDPFFTTKEPGRGLGLGLSISYNIVRDFDGSLRFAPAEGGGTRAILELHRVDEERVDEGREVRGAAHGGG